MATTTRTEVTGGTVTYDRARCTDSAGRPSRGTMVLALVAVVGLLAFLLAPVAQAQKGGTGGLSLEARVAALESRVSALQSENATQAQQITNLQTENTTQATQISQLQSENTALQSADTALDNRITPLETKTAPLSVSGNNFIISGKNVHIVDGTGLTWSTSGLGNLTIGYNASRGTRYTNVRTGSHNLILGDGNNYSSYGGLVAGVLNTISGRYASVSGGSNNVASGNSASVSGGWLNTASDYTASVSGGEGNTASAIGASVSGGWLNTASASYASVSGGYQRSAPGYVNWAAGSLLEDH